MPFHCNAAVHSCRNGQSVDPRVHAGPGHEYDLHGNLSHSCEDAKPCLVARYESMKALEGHLEIVSFRPSG